MTHISLVDFINVNLIGKILKSSASDTAKTAILGHLLQTYETGFLVHLRQLLSSKEKGAGGKLLHDLQSTISPTINKKELSTIWSKIDKFIQQDYYKSLITQNEAYELHKDNNPINHKVVNHGSIKIRRKLAYYDVYKICECLESFSEILIDATKLSMINRPIFSMPDTDIDLYIDNFLSIFSHNLPANEVKCIRSSIRNNLELSLKLVGWLNNKNTDYQYGNKKHYTCKPALRFCGEPFYIRLSRK